MIEMLKSLYTYNYGTDSIYYRELEKKYGKEKVKKAWEDIKQKYEIVYNVYEDSEGVTYNNAILKERNKEEFNYVS